MLHLLTRLSIASLVAGCGVVAAVDGSSMAASNPTPAHCSAADVAVDVPAADPYVHGVDGTVVWTLRFTNRSARTCALAGWPAVTATTKTASATRFAHAAGNDEFSIRRAPVVLRPGSSAGASVLDRASAAGCASPWHLAVSVGGAAKRIGMGHDMFGPCEKAAKPSVSPYFAMSRLTTGFPAQSAQPTTNVPACKASDLHASAVGTRTSATASVVAIRLTSTALTSCALAGAYPTVSVGSGRTARMAKATPALAPIASAAAAPTTSSAPSSPAALRAGHPVVLSVVLASASAKNAAAIACRSTRALSYYPGGDATGRPVRLTLRAAVRACGTPAVAPYLDGSPAPAVAQRTAAALTRMRTSVSPAVNGTVNPLDTAGFWYGTDSNAPTATTLSSGVYYEPAGAHGSSPGRYGWYGGEIDSYFKWKNCGGIWDGANFNSTNASHANSNLNSHSVGVGTAAYWMMAGPGADPNYNGTTSEATAFGKAQAARVGSDISSRGSTFTNATVYADIEDATRTGWNAVWSGGCGAWGGSERYSYVDAALDSATFNGFWSYIYNNTAYLGGAYCAGGSSGDTWSNIFGSISFPSGASAEWTYTNETSSTATFPSSWSVNGVNAVFFGGVSGSDTGSGSQAGVWQWSGGNGTSNGYGDFDQIYAAGHGGLHY